MPKRIVDGEAIATSKKVKSLPTEYRLHYPYLLTLGMAYGTFECDPEVVWAKLYAYLLPEVTIDFVSKMLNCLEEKKLLFRWQAEPDKTWGYWVGSDKPGRLPSKSRVDKSHVASGYMPPMREVNQWLASGCPVATLGSGLGSGERPAPFFQNQESEKSMKIISLLAPISLKVLGQRIEPDAWTNVWDEVEEFVDAYGEARLVKDFETWAKQNQGDSSLSNPMRAYLKVAATRLYEGPRAAPPPAQEFFVWLSTSYEELVLTPKERQAIAEVVRSGAALADLQLAAQRILVGLNLSSSYEHAGQKLAANLADKLVVIERERSKQAQYKQLEEAAARETQAALAREPDAQEKEGEPEEDPF